MLLAVLGIKLAIPTLVVKSMSELYFAYEVKQNCRALLFADAYCLDFWLPLRHKRYILKYGSAPIFNNEFDIGAICQHTAQTIFNFRTILKVIHVFTSSTDSLGVII